VNHKGKYTATAAKKGRDYYRLKPFISSEKFYEQSFKSLEIIQYCGFRKGKRKKV
jgi:hypothetical protein